MTPMNIIAQYQHDNGVKDKDMAKASGLDRSTVTHHRLGTKPIGYAAALRYHKAFGIPLQDLLPDLYQEADTTPGAAA